VVVQAAMLRSEKGHRTTLDAITVLKDRYPNIACVLAGSGPKEADLRRRAEKLGLVAHVCFAGLVVPVAPLLARADVVIMPSRNEPLGLAQLEALALGVPVVVSDAGGLPETVVDGETGWVVPSGDPGAWAAAIASAVDDPKEALRRASLGGDRVRAEYSGAAHLRALDEIVATAR
jgi:glycosyltransferase involved in cell wall biosynthesis